ncbi:High-affinity nitrate transporter 2.1 [Dinochytrium kinnereticum]|nr:High-affinity nitrate transporter 2.1 [Dinochytrium kinnereticum]
MLISRDPSPPNAPTTTVDSNDANTPGKPFSIFTNTRLTLDANGRATNIKLLSLSRPHMRSFHLSWLAFFIAFTGWFAYSPLLKKTIAPNLKMAESDISNSDISNVSATVVFRMLIGPLVDKLGASRVMALVLVLGSIPLGLSVLSTGAVGIVVSRLFIGILGTSFVPCQYWTTALFSRNVVGTANAIAGGWGNMGAGVTYLIMPQIYNLFKNAIGWDIGKSWRAAMLVPVVLIWIVAFLCYRFGDDKPFTSGSPPVDASDSTTEVDVESVTTAGKNVEVESTTKIQGDGETIVQHVVGGSALASRTSVWTIILKCLTTPSILILMVHYACCFGVELSVDSVIGNYFIKTFGLDQATGALFGALFGLMNIFSRATGGLVSDICAHRIGQRGRIMWQAFLFLVSTAALIGFSYGPDMGSSIFALIIFSYSTEAGAGSTFGIVPFISPFMGAASGLVGAGGNIGGALFNVLFRVYVEHPREAFRYMGITIAIGGLLSSFFLVVEGDYIMRQFFEKRRGAAGVPAEKKTQGGKQEDELEVVV